MKSIKYLEMLKAKTGAKTDTQLAEILQKGQNTISQYMTGKRVMDDETCLAIALKLDINPIEIIGAACIDRAEKSGQKSLWEVFMTRMAVTANALLFALNVNLFLTPTPAEAAPMLHVDRADFILCKIAFARMLKRLQKNLSIFAGTVRAILTSFALQPTAS